MGNAQCTSVHNAKYSFESIESSLSKGKSPLEQSILKEYQSIKYKSTNVSLRKKAKL